MNLLLQSNPPKMLKLSKQTVLRFVRLHNILGKDLVYLFVWLFVGSVTILFVFFCIWYLQNLRKHVFIVSMSSLSRYAWGGVNYKACWRILALDLSSSENNFFGIICVYVQRFQTSHVQFLFTHTPNMYSLVVIYLRYFFG